jgi:hypothetical protein
VVVRDFCGDSGEAFTCGVTGREADVKELMRKFPTPYVDEVKEDNLGNIARAFVLFLNARPAALAQRTEWQFGLRTTK